MNLPNDDFIPADPRYFLEAAKNLDANPARWPDIKSSIFYELGFHSSHPLRKEFEVAREVLWYSSTTSHETRILFLLFLDTIIQSGDSLQ